MWLFYHFSGQKKKKNAVTLFLVQSNVLMYTRMWKQAIASLASTQKVTTLNKAAFYECWISAVIYILGINSDIKID